MADTYKHPHYNSPAPHLPVGDATLIRSFSLSSTTTQFGVQDDVLMVCTLGRGDKIGGGCFVQTDDLDTGATHVMSLEVTNGTTTKTVIDGATTGQAGGLVRPTKDPSTEDGVGYVVPDGTYWVQAICDTAAAGEQASATLVVGVQICGHRDNDELTE